MIKKKGNSHKILHFFMIVSLIFAFVFYMYYNSNSLGGLVVFQTKNQSDFDGGTYSNTEWSGNYVGISSGQKSGTYTSKVFDASSSVTWINFSWIDSKPTENRIIVVDKASDVWKSANGGVTWSLVKDDYNGNE